MTSLVFNLWIFIVFWRKSVELTVVIKVAWNVLSDWTWKVYMADECEKRQRFATFEIESAISILFDIPWLKLFDPEKCRLNLKD